MPKILTTYTIPESVRKSASNPLPSKITMRELSSSEELQSFKVGRGDPMKGQYDACVRAIVALDGQPVSYADGSVDKFWEGCGPKMRTLLLQAHARMSGTTNEEDASFFASAEIQTS
jgi:hypothetical protein